MAARRIPVARVGVAMILSVAGCAHLQPITTDESTPTPGVHLTSRLVRYAVRGHTVRELRAQMSRIGPIDDGGHQFAHTWGTYAWRWPHEVVTAGCTTGPVSVELEIVQTFPAWIDQAGAGRSTVGEWTRWLAATGNHEAGHRAILLASARALIDKLGGVAPQPDCEALDRAANAVGEAVLQEMRARHAAFDRTTRHGATFGAVLRE